MNALSFRGLGWLVSMTFNNVNVTSPYIMALHLFKSVVGPKHRQTVEELTFAGTLPLQLGGLCCDLRVVRFETNDVAPRDASGMQQPSRVEWHIDTYPSSCTNKSCFAANFLCCQSRIGSVQTSLPTSTLGGQRATTSRRRRSLKKNTDILLVCVFER